MKIAVVSPTAIPSRRANTIQVMKMTQAFANLGHTVRLAAGPRQIMAGFLGGFSLLSDYSGALSLTVLGVYLLGKEWEEHSHGSASASASTGAKGR